MCAQVNSTGQSPNFLIYRLHVSALIHSYSLSRYRSGMKTCSLEYNNSNQRNFVQLTQGQKGCKHIFQFQNFLMLNRIQKTMHFKNVSSLGLLQCFLKHKAQVLKQIFLTLGGGGGTHNETYFYESKRLFSWKLLHIQVLADGITMNIQVQSLPLVFVLFCFSLFYFFALSPNKEFLL